MSIVEFMEIPAELILYCDQIVIKIVPACARTIGQQGSTLKRMEIEKTMLALSEVILPYIERIRASLKESKPALVITDNFKGQYAQEGGDVLEQNDILVCRLPPNRTDHLQPMDLSVNKPTKDFLKRKFEQWYAEEMNNQLQGEDLETATLQPVDLAMLVMKKLEAKWLVEMADYIL